MAHQYAQVTDFTSCQAWLGEGNSVQGCRFTLIGEQRIEGLRAYFNDGSFTVDSDPPQEIDAVTGSLAADAGFASLIADFLHDGETPAFYEVWLRHER